MDNNHVSKRYYDEEAERTIIRSMLFNNESIKEVMERVDCEDFYFGHNREIVETIFSLYSDSKEISHKAVLDAMRARGVCNEDVEHYIEHIGHSASSSGNELICCVIVKGYAVMRRMVLIEDSIACLISEEPDKAWEKIQVADQMCQTVIDFHPKEGFLPVSELMSDVFNGIMDRGNEDGKNEGLSTGYSFIDRSTRGLHPKEVTVIAARPAMGKTSFGLNIALNVARSSGKTVAVFSAEHTRDQIICRLLSMEGLVNAKRIMRGLLSDEEWGRLVLSVSSLNKMDIRINDNESLSIEDISSQCCRMDNLGLIIIDYLQLIKTASIGGKKEKKARKCSRISKKIKHMAELLNVPVVVLSQLSRQSETRSYKKPQLSDLDIYGTVIADADVVIGLYREVYYNPLTEYKNDAEAIIMKNTHGWVGPVPLNWNAEYLTFTDREPEE